MLKTKKTIVTKVISFILSMLILFYAVPSVVYAETIDALSNLGSDESSASVENSSSAADFKLPMYEVEELREENVKHFKLSDGSYVAAQYNYPVHYEDESGKLIDIDNALADASGGVYANKNARVKFSKKITGNESLFTLHDGNTKITFSLIGAEKGTKGVVTNREDSKEDTELQKMMNLENLTSSVIYKDILDGTDLEYVVESLNIKENIIVKEKKDAYVYTFEIKLNGLTAALTDSGDIEIADVSSGEVKYVIPAPVIYDAEGAYAEHGVGSYTLSDGGNGKYTLVVSVSGEWMNSEERVFPVTVDPTVKVSNSTVVDLTISSSTPNTVNENEAQLLVAPGAIAYWWVDSDALPNLPYAAYITSASIILHTNVFCFNEYVCAHEVTSPWNASTLTWNTHNAGNDAVGKLADAITDYNILSDQGAYSWDITPIVKKWYTGTNYGVAFQKAPNLSAAASFHSSESSTDSYAPALMVSYRSMAGLEDYWAYSSHSAGVAGSGSINLANGNLVFAIPTLSTTDSLMPFTPTLVYNSLFENMPYIYPHHDTANQTAYMPYGFKLNICETILKKTYTKIEGTEESYYVYADADGTEHAFYTYDTATGTYMDENGLQKRLTVTSNGKIEITDDSKTVRTFSRSGNFYEDAEGGWYLSKITDKNGNSIKFTYESTLTLRPTNVLLIPNGSSEIELLQFHYYSNGRLQMVYNPTSKDAVVFRYSNDYNGSISANSGMYLRQIDYAHASGNGEPDWDAFANSASNTTNITVDATASYEYTEHNQKYYLYSVSDNLAKQKIEYGFFEYKVRTVTQKAFDTSAGTYEDGNYLTFLYRTKSTDVISPSKAKDIGSNEQPKFLTTRYVFDKEGRSTSVYSFATDRTDIYGATVGEYETDENVKNNLKEQTILGGVGVNYILNGSFEESSNSTFDNWSVTGGVTRTATTVDETEGLYSARFRPIVGQPASISQSLYLPAGTYTLSMQYRSQTSGNAQGTVNVNSIAGSGLEWSETVSLSRDFSTGSYSVFSTTFTVPPHINGKDKVNITIQFTAIANQAVSPNIYIDRVMLEKNLGSTEYSLVRYGSFDTVGLNSSGAEIPLMNYWTTESNTAPTVATDELFGNVVKVTGNLTSNKYVVQRIYEADASELTSAISSASGKDYVISGFGKSENAMFSSNAFFGLEVKITYYENGVNRTEWKKFEFIPDCDGWQFTGGSFSTENVCVKSIDVYCSFSKQAATAYFDDISVVTVIDASIETYEYHKEGIFAGLVKEKSNKFYTEYYEYYDNRNLKRVANNRGEITDYNYYDSSNLVEYYVECSFVDANGGGVYPAYSNNPDSEINKTPKLRTDYEYDNYGLVTDIKTYPVDADLEITDGGKMIHTQYYYLTSVGSKVFGALYREIDSLNTDIYYYYDNNDGSLLATVNATENTGMCYTYDEMGRLTGVMPATYVDASSYGAITNAENVSYTYNDRNLLSTITTDSTTYTFTYDAFGNTESVAAGGNELAEHSYNSYNGLLNKTTYGNGFVVEYEYNDVDLLTKICYTKGTEPKKTAYEYEYTADGQVYKFVDNITGKTTKYKYDANNRVVGIVEYKNDELYHTYASTYLYNDKGQLTDASFSQHLSSHFGAIQAYSYTYDSTGKLERVNINTTSAAENVSNGTETYEYDEYDRVKKQTNRLISISDAIDTFTNEISYTYKNNGDKTSSLVESYTSKVHGTSVVYNYTYDRNGNITKIEHSSGREIRYEYDDLGQLIREENEFAWEVYVYEYDAAGNIDEKNIYPLQASGSIVNNPTTYDYVYSTSDWGDILTSYRGQTIEYDVIGNPTRYYNGSSYNFTWTGRQLTGATKDNVAYSFTYNDEGMRTSKTKGSVTTTYYLDGSRIVGEETNGNLTIYIYDASGMPIGMQYHDSSYSNEVWDVYWYERNLQGDIVAVYNGIGDKIVSYTYDAWGNCTATSTTNTVVANNPFRYRGYYYDKDLGLYYLQTRYYDANTGRFISPDGYVSTGQGILGYNMYAYCGNNPVIRADASGDSWRVIVAVVVITAKVVKATIRTVNKILNSKLDADSSTTTKNKIIKSQKKAPAEEFMYGLFPVSYNGCEAIAVHNAMQMLGMDTSLSNVIDDFHSTWATFGIIGVFGAVPYQIGRVLRQNNVKYERIYRADQMNRSGIYIVSYWNKNLKDGLHTIAVKYDGETYVGFNELGEHFDPNNLGVRYIHAYYLGEY